MALKNIHPPELDLHFLCADGFPNSNFGKPKRLLVISFSGGRTSAFMAWLLIRRYKGIRDILVVFANTGKEREETLEFVHNCDLHFGFNTVWIETCMTHGKRVGAKYRTVTYETASRNGEPFEDVIKKFGVPNVASKHCTRELKSAPITKLIRTYGYGRYYDMAIGIRADEPKRYKPKPHFFYPLFTDTPVTKLQVNKWWAKQPFDLQLKGYEGNCDLCYKKSKRKLLTILVEHPEFACWWDDMETKYGTVGLNDITRPWVFYRDDTSVMELLEDSQRPFKWATDDFTLQQLMHSDPEMDFTDGCEASCEAF